MVIPYGFHYDLVSKLLFSLRVRTYDGAVLINFCESVDHDMILLYLDPIMERLLKFLNNPSGNPSMVHYLIAT